MSVFSDLLRRPPDDQRPRRSPGARSSATASVSRRRSAACAGRCGPGRSASSATSCCSPSSSARRRRRPARHAAATVRPAGRSSSSSSASTAGGAGAGTSTQRRRDAPAVVPRWATAPERAAYLRRPRLAVVACCFVVFREIGAGWPAPTWYYLADAWIFVGSILATYAMARGWVDFWLCWIAVDLVGVPMLLHFEFYPSAVLYGVYGVLRASAGFFAWRRIAREAADRPTRRDRDGASVSDCTMTAQRAASSTRSSARSPTSRAGRAGRRRRRRGPRERGRPRSSRRARRHRSCSRFMIRHTRGVICVPMEGAELDRLGSR